jgi:hypothetical protein
MSPQMNGEPREAEVTTADRATSANRPASPIHNADQPMLEAISTDGVTKTAMRDDAKLAPLFTQDAATDFRARWDVVQRSFVDDPREAVRTGNELVAEVIKSLADSFADQRSDPDNSLDKTGAPTTENLRLALRRYRSFFERLLSI